MKLKTLMLTLAFLLSGQAIAQNSESKPAEAAPAAAAPAEAAPAAEAPKAASTTDEETGVAAYYGKKFAGRRTASGQRFNPNAMTAAHRTLPFGTKVRVTNTKNKRKVVVVINDRGPTSQDRIIDVSYAAAKKLGLVKSGLGEVKIEVVGKQKLKGKQ